ncbi:4-(cytidine 5'-diphospho)-2-C-methyl-D-erythritol kinase [Geitlerinema sp. PCC 9228]|uniref:4-(cytidine 5'-diphospho)-2-C-methyl-D-erythritol kinase n=1 Tax=Geitlerinema sp. PCC 9228 TaxID=111611 RepID=UPI0008F9C003|nr:4-(cytidine 5'-diphospho)-2-C-methyl-D-erythritol kinase [Geitlerinema sp. PCC 9228]
MRACSFLAPAKINLYLEIVGEDIASNGQYHELVMVMQTIDLCDRVSLNLNGLETFHLTCHHPQVPNDSSNLAYRAADLMRAEFPDSWAQYGGVNITIDKYIPVAAGLAGGSSNAAAVLVGLNTLWNLGLTQPELQGLGSKLGADVPFCIVGGTVLATGRGDCLSPLPDLEDFYVVLAKHKSVSVSTGWAYQTYRQQFGSTYPQDALTLAERRQRFHSGEMVAAIGTRDREKIAQQLHNDLEKVVLPAYPQVQALREAFVAAGALGTLMSGSGPTVFGLCLSLEDAQVLQENVKASVGESDIKFCIAKLTSTGIDWQNYERF